MSASVPSPGRLRAESVTLRYDQRVVSTGLSVDVPGDEFTVIIGPNACGKSTLLRSLSRLLRPAAGEVTLDGRSLASFKPKEFARTVGLLPQSSIAPEGITVVDLVSRGRFPYQKLVRQWTDADEAAVRDAMTATNVAELATREVAELSGGQRQRVWAAMVIAQQTPILLLDEPTTYLDIAHQVELLDLLAELNAERGTTVVMVLHDLNLACRYAHHIVAMKSGHVIAQGTPQDVITAEVVDEVFGLPCRVVPDPVTGTPLVVPLGRQRGATPAD